MTKPKCALSVCLSFPLVVTVVLMWCSLHRYDCFHWFRDQLHTHSIDVDLEFGIHTKEEIALFESYQPKPGLGTKTPPVEADGVHQNDVLTVVIDFKDSSQGVTTDIIGNQMGEFDVTSFGFDANEFDMVANAIFEEVREDFFDELAGTVANQNGQDFEINFIQGDIGTPPVGISEYYYVQVGAGLEGPFVFALGVARSSAIRNSAGFGPNNDAEIGDIVASVFTNNIQGISNLSPSNALSSGNLTFTRNAVVGTLSHEIGHALSLSHINFSGSQQPGDASPIMGTGAIDLPNQERITDRQFSLSGMNAQNDDVDVFQIAQLVGAIGLDDVFDGNLENTELEITTGTTSDGLADIIQDDSNVLTIVASPKSATPIQFQVVADSPLLNPSSLFFTIESRSNSPNVEQVLELFNFSTQSFETVNSSLVGTGFDTIELVLEEEAGNYFNPATCQLRCRVSYAAVGPVLFFPWSVDVDQVRFEVAQ